MKEEWRKWKDSIDKPGWYWVLRQLDRYDIYPEIVKVRIYSKKLCISNSEIPSNVKWAGPIPQAIDASQEITK